MTLSDHARALLSGPNLAYLATLLPDGSPHVTPMWVALEGERILFGTVIGRVKERNLRRDPRVAFAVTDAANLYDKVDVRGRVVAVEEDPAEVRRLGRLIAATYGVHDWQGIPGARSAIFFVEADAVYERM